MGPGPGLQQGLPPVGPDEQQLSAATGRVAADSFAFIARLAEGDGTGEIETIAHIQDIFRHFRALISDMKMAVEEQETPEEKIRMSHHLAFYQGEYDRAQEAFREAKLTLQRNRELAYMRQRAELIGSLDYSARQRKFQSEQELLQGQEDVTAALRRTRQLMLQNVEQQHGNLSVLDTTNVKLSNTKDELQGQKQVYKQSHGLLGALKRQATMQWVWVFIALGIFSSSVVYVGIKRTPVAVKDGVMMAMRIPLEGARQLGFDLWPGLGGGGGVDLSAGEDEEDPWASEFNRAKQSPPSPSPQQQWLKQQQEARLQQQQERERLAKERQQQLGQQQGQQQRRPDPWEEAKWLDADGEGNQRVEREGGKVWEGTGRTTGGNRGPGGAGGNGQQLPPGGPGAGGARPGGAGGRDQQQRWQQKRPGHNPRVPRPGRPGGLLDRQHQGASPGDLGHVQKPGTPTAGAGGASGGAAAGAGSGAGGLLLDSLLSPSGAGTPASDAPPAASDQPPVTPTPGDAQQPRPEGALGNLLPAALEAEQAGGSQKASSDGVEPPGTPDLKPQQPLSGSLDDPLPALDAGAEQERSTETEGQQAAAERQPGFEQQPEKRQLGQKQPPQDANDLFADFGHFEEHPEGKEAHAAAEQAAMEEAAAAEAAAAEAAAAEAAAAEAAAAEAAAAEAAAAEAAAAEAAAAEAAAAAAAAQQATGSQAAAEEPETKEEVEQDTAAFGMAASEQAAAEAAAAEAAAADKAAAEAAAAEAAAKEAAATEAAAAEAAAAEKAAAEIAAAEAAAKEAAAAEAAAAEAAAAEKAAAEAAAAEAAAKEAAAAVAAAAEAAAAEAAAAAAEAAAKEAAAAEAAAAEAAAAEAAAGEAAAAEKAAAEAAAAEAAAKEAAAAEAAAAEAAAAVAAAAEAAAAEAAAKEAAAREAAAADVAAEASHDTAAEESAVDGGEPVATHAGMAPEEHAPSPADEEHAPSEASSQDQWHDASEDELWHDAEQPDHEHGEPPAASNEDPRQQHWEDVTAAAQEPPDDGAQEVDWQVLHEQPPAEAVEQQGWDELHQQHEQEQQQEQQQQPADTAAVDIPPAPDPAPPARKAPALSQRAQVQEGIKLRRQKVASSLLASLGARGAVPSAAGGGTAKQDPLLVDPAAVPSRRLLWVEEEEGSDVGQPQQQQQPLRRHRGGAWRLPDLLPDLLAGAAAADVSVDHLAAKPQGDPVAADLDQIKMSLLPGDEEFDGAHVEALLAEQAAAAADEGAAGAGPGALDSGAKESARELQRRTGEALEAVGRVMDGVVDEEDMDDHEEEEDGYPYEDDHEEEGYGEDGDDTPRSIEEL